MNFFYNSSFITLNVLLIVSNDWKQNFFLSRNEEWEIPIIAVGRTVWCHEWTIRKHVMKLKNLFSILSIHCVILTEHLTNSRMIFNIEYHQSWIQPQCNFVFFLYFIEQVLMTTQNLFAPEIPSMLSEPFL